MQKCGMFRNEVEGAVEEGFAGFHAVPGRGAARVGQGNEIEAVGAVASEADVKLFADALIEAAIGEELFNG